MDPNSDGGWPKCAPQSSAVSQTSVPPAPPGAHIRARGVEKCQLHLPISANVGPQISPLGRISAGFADLFGPLLDLLNSLAVETMSGLRHTCHWSSASAHRKSPCLSGVEKVGGEAGAGASLHVCTWI